ncbi:DUF5077 domain-containing protein [Algoriphagus aquimarinus]|uniref:DUF5077 domain-containing protein n=1 Tax=Algoriphagus aquimarinus TaxID=237018 RepID=UPI0030D932FD|tara:strand:+ start:1095 stop:1676 length:582 start_codon:yes stop_codon:yes gene_type:complete
MNFRFTIFFYLLLTHLTFTVALCSEFTSYSIEVPLGGNTFQTKGTNTEKVTAEGILHWKNSDTEFSIYVKSDKVATISLALDIISQAGNSQISVNLNGQNQLVNLDAGTTVNISVGELELIKGYNVINLRGVEKSGPDFAKIKALQIKSDETLTLDFVKDNVDNRYYWGRRGPSVHLSYTLPADKDFNGFTMR